MKHCLVAVLLSLPSGAPFATAPAVDARALAGYVECRVRSGEITPLVVARLKRVAPAFPDDPDIQRMSSQVRE